MAAGKTAKSILISCGARLAPFDIKELREVMSYDEMELHTLGDRKTALFIIISDTDDSFSFVAAMMYSQLFNLLCDRADALYYRGYSSKYLLFLFGGSVICGTDGRTQALQHFEKNRRQAVILLFIPDGMNPA